MNMASYQYRKPHWGDTTVVKSYYHHNIISYTGKALSAIAGSHLDYFVRFKKITVPVKNYRQCFLPYYFRSISFFLICFDPSLKCTYPLSSSKHQIALSFPSLPRMLFLFEWPPWQRTNMTLVKVPQREEGKNEKKSWRETDAFFPSQTKSTNDTGILTLGLPKKDNETEERKKQQRTTIRGETRPTKRAEKEQNHKARPFPYYRPRDKTKTPDTT